ncbi:hypothetical protein [Roseivirga misakiensis]|uniref:Uncharacterized protein n=1 Tax=Roseivirga misakiensis TaxID=1563681 RepID=A0A1E5T1A0_9BACT|nr:hypothetical protein [Roseivirga misakiensis]OEK05136.1 hypothetical protein BFP71_17115 [Roseivirga misakiensis]
MKNVSKRNISALFALLLAGTILTSTKTNTVANLPEYDALADNHYTEYVDEFVDEYFDDIEEEVFESQEYVKVYDERDELIVDGLRSELGEEQLQVLRQADLLTELSGTKYYQLNN